MVERCDSEFISTASGVSEQTKYEFYREQVAFDNCQIYRIPPPKSFGRPDGFVSVSDRGRPAPLNRVGLAELTKQHGHELALMQLRTAGESELAAVQFQRLQSGRSPRTHPIYLVWIR